MPRPGPRPYECVRRAWHSDRHQPMRGSLIKEIFRVVNEIHSTATKKNKEWQDKLPIVVLKAEEIMYSKANSEAEYMDLKTLWDRANDAINTIIRRDESTETGAFLQPCIEAALNLGCIPRRASRSQRNNTPSCYLSATNPEPICAPSTNIENTTHLNNPTNIPFIPHYSNFTKPNSKNSTPFALDHHSPVVQNNHFSLNKPSLPPKKYPPSGKNEALCSYPGSNPCLVYALHYGDIQSKPSNFHLGLPSKSNSNSIEPSEICVKKNTTREDFVKEPENPLGIGCDLSLRLGPLVGPCISIENSWPHESDDVGLNTSREGSKLSDSSSKIDKSFSFIPMANMGDLLNLDPGKWSSETENLNEDKTLRKRKAADVAEDRQFSWQLEVPFKHFRGRMSNAGS